MKSRAIIKPFAVALLYLLGGLDCAMAQLGGEGGGYDPCVPIEACFPTPPTPTLSGSGQSSTGNYTLTWSGDATELWESVNGGAWIIRDLTIEAWNLTSYSFSGKPPGSYSYQLRNCFFSCSTFSNTITV